MEKFNYTQEMKNRTQGFERGYVFTITDFADISDYENRKKALMRFANDGLIRRVKRGIYEYPEYSKFMNESVPTSPDKVAKAIARQHGWSIAPCGDTALNLLGLSTQVPAVWCYISDGPYKTYRYGKVIIEFKRTTNKEISKLSYKTALVIQALKALGKNNANKIAISKIASKLNTEEKEKMYNEAKYATDWVYKAIRSIYSEEINNA